MTFGKLSPTNGGAIKVYSAALNDTTIVARLLLTDAKVFFSGPLRITKGNFINAPKSQVHGWIRACGRNEADLAGPANDKNTVYACRTGEVTYDLHFVELNDTSTTRDDSRDSSLEQPQQANPTRDRSRQSQTTYEHADASQRLYSIEHLRESNWTRVPVGPGVYWWFFPTPHLESLGVAQRSIPDGLRLRRANGKLCLYVGIAASLRQRIQWHAAQRLSQSALRSGTLSTFRFSLLALAGLDYNAGDAEINELMKQALQGELRDQQAEKRSLRETLAEERASRRQLEKRLRNIERRGRERRTYLWVCAAASMGTTVLALASWVGLTLLNMPSPVLWTGIGVFAVGGGLAGSVAGTYLNGPILSSMEWPNCLRRVTVGYWTLVIMGLAIELTGGWLSGLLTD